MGTVLVWYMKPSIDSYLSVTYTADPGSFMVVVCENVAILDFLVPMWYNGVVNDLSPFIFC